MAKKKETDISTQKFLIKLRVAVREAGGPTAASREWGVAAQHLGSALSGKKLPTPRILAVMGYEPIKEILYRYKRVK